ncbi:hypothetical protein NPIL_241151 [Nephila pilipes]|uniref:Uncharacterized protein n=1 Tax=Nephila pilipes TaxID=299642 RepID=A0A8X6QXN3_NEPPI|nr:hypothetical protein NPIL_241151 [Nephila pilipes]
MIFNKNFSKRKFMVYVGHLFSLYQQPLWSSSKKFIVKHVNNRIASTTNMEFQLCMTLDGTPFVDLSSYCFRNFPALRPLRESKDLKCPPLTHFLLRVVRNSSSQCPR